MINFDYYDNEKKTEHDKKWTYVPDHPYRILTMGGSGSKKTNVLLNLIESQSDTDKIYLYAKGPYEEKYQYLINIREKVSLKFFNDPKTFIEYSNYMSDVYKNINEYNIDKERNCLLQVLTELFIRGRKINISLVFFTQSYFKVPKDVRLNTTHFFIA